MEAMKTVAKCENTGEPLHYCAGPFLSLVERILRPTEAVSVTITGLVHSEAVAKFEGVDP